MKQIIQNITPSDINISSIGLILVSGGKIDILQYIDMTELQNADDLKTLVENGDINVYTDMTSAALSISDAINHLTFESKFADDVDPDTLWGKDINLDTTLFDNLLDQTNVTVQSAIEQIDDKSKGILIFDELNHTNGFDTQQEDLNGQLSQSNSIRTLTISPKSGQSEYNFQVDGTNISYSTSKSLVIPNITEVYYIYFDNNGELQYTTADAMSLDVIYKYALVALVHWNATQGIGLCGSEMHGIRMDSRTHHYLHTAVGARFNEGIDILGLANANTQYTSINGGSFQDEDVYHKVNSSTIHYQLYRLGTTGEQTISSSKDNKVGYKHNVGDTYCSYNEFDGTEYKLTQGGASTDFYITFFMAMPNINNDIIYKIPSQNAYATRGAARTAIESEINKLKIDGLPSLETVFLYAVIVKRSGKLVVLADGGTYYDLRIHRGESVGASAVNPHADDIPTDTTNFNNSLSTSDTNVQKALDTLDEHTHSFTDILDPNYKKVNIATGNYTMPSSFAGVLMVNFASDCTVTLYRANTIANDGYMREIQIKNATNNKVTVITQSPDVFNAGQNKLVLHNKNDACHIGCMYSSTGTNSQASIATQVVILKKRRAASWDDSNFDSAAPVPFDTVDISLNDAVLEPPASYSTRVTSKINGFIELSYQLRITSDSGQGSQSVYSQVRKNGSTELSGTRMFYEASDGKDASISLATIIDECSPNDYYELMLDHSSLNGSLNTAWLTGKILV